MTEESETFDLIVVGAGAGGMTAALVAALEGLKVVLCEATHQVGGTTATSAGTLWVPGNRLGAAVGHGDTVKQAECYLDALVGSDDSRLLRRAFLDSAAEAVDDLQRRTALAFVSSGKHPDYLDLPGAAISGRAISPVEFDGRLLGGDFDRVRPPMPEFMVLGGMMAGKADVLALVNRYRSWTHAIRTLRLVFRYCCDRLTHRRGTRLVMGNALVARLLKSLRDADVVLRFGWKLEELELQNGQVTGAVFDVQGSPQRIGARKGVVLACGGVGHGQNLRESLGMPGFAAGSLAAESVKGEGLAAAVRAGARLEQDGKNFLWQPVSVVKRANGEQGLFPHLYLDRTKPGLIAVNAAGARFVNEAASYHHFVEAMLNQVSAGVAMPRWYLVCDADFVARWGLGVIPPGTRHLKPWVAHGYLHMSPTLEGLARQSGMVPDVLLKTVARSNRFAQTGHDPDFGKGDSELNRFNGDPAHTPNPCLGIVQTPPYVALPVWPADAASSAGLTTDVFGRVMSTADVPLPGLYACGNDAASIMQGGYPGPGATLGPAMVFGWRIGRYVAGRFNPP